MADYKEAEVSGKEWQRCVRVVIENPYGGKPSINFVEESAVKIGERTITNLCGNLTTAFDPKATFPAYDEDGKFVRDISHVEVYGLMNALYMHLAGLRDNPVVAPVIEEPVK